MKVVELKLEKDKNGEGITAISLVKNPAIEQNWIAFSKDGIAKPDKRFAFKTIDEDQRILAGPAMIPDKLIYRKDPGEDGEEYFVFFNGTTIRELSERFLLQGKQNNMTLEHEATLNDLSVVESWIVEDSEKDKSAMYGFELPVGSWFVKVKVLNDDVWNLVKENSVAGFSVEGVFTREIIKNSKQTMKKQTLDGYLDKIRNLFNKDGDEAARVKLALITEISKWDIEVKNSSFAVGDEVLQVFEDGSEIKVNDGEYLLEDGRKIHIDSDGKIVLIQERGEFNIPEQITAKPKEEPKPDDSGNDQFGTVEAEGADGTITINFPGEVLEVGAAITVTVEEAEVPVPTGEYTLSDGTTLVVVEEGVVGELREAEGGDEDGDEMDKDGLKQEQINALIDGIADIISKFKAEIEKSTEEAVKAEIEKLRVEFNKPAGKVTPKTPEDSTKKAVVQGLSKFVEESNKPDDK